MRKHKNLHSVKSIKKQPKFRYFYAKSSFMLADRDTLMRVDLTARTQERFFSVSEAMRQVEVTHRDKAICSSIQIDCVIEISKEDYEAINRIRKF